MNDSINDYLRVKRIIRIITVFMVTTYMLAFISPIRYSFKDPIKMTIYVCLYFISFYLGSVSFSQKDAYSEIQEDEEHSEHWLCISIVLLLVYTVISTFNNMLATGTNNLLSALVIALSNTSKVYYARAELQSSVLLNVITILGSPIFVYGSVYGLLKFKSLKVSFKVLYILFLVFEVLKWMFVGTNKGIFDVGILFAIVLILFKPSERKHKSGSFKRILLVVLITYAAICFFGYTMQSRLGSSYEMLGDGTYTIVYNHFLFRIFPSSVVFLLIHLIDYLIQGYYGFSLGLTFDWQPTFFAGSNVFLRNYIQPITGLNITERLYQSRIESVFGWGAESKWHTMYLWLANDFGPLGVIVVMFIIGHFLRGSLNDGLRHNNAYALCFAYLILKALFYSSANNQILGTYEIITVIVFFVLWKKKKKVAIVIGKRKLYI